MIKPWEFIIEKSEDLIPFHDLLEEWGHPGHLVVKKLIKRKKFPKRSFKGKNSQKPDVWYWMMTNKSKQSHCLPSDDYNYGHKFGYRSPTEAIWSIINADIYQSQGKT
jgi:hypothetical protein